MRLSPQDLKALGVGDGGYIRLRNALGEVVARACPDPGCSPGLAFMPASALANRLTSYDGSTNLPDFKHIEVKAEAKREPSMQD